MEPNSFDRIAPVPIDLGAGRKAAAGTGAAGIKLKRVLPMIALGALVILALAVIFLLPRLRPAMSTPATAEAPATRTSAATATTPAATPAATEDETARMAARSAAQALLEQVRELEANLKNIGVETWATAPFQNATTALAAGERAYQALDYSTARNAYQSAVTQMQALQQQSESVFTGAIQRGNEALENGTGATATQAFNTALLIHPDDAAARKGAARARTIDQVRELVRRGEGLAQDRDTAGAAKLYQQALDLDPEFTPARERLNAVRAELGAQAYRAAMSAGFAALAAGDAGRARGHFAEALRLKPGAPEARDALHQAETRATSAAIEQHIATAQAAERTEDWNAAMVAWDAALKLDANLMAAHNGIDTATARRNLDQQLAAAIAQPERLGDDKVQEEANALLARAGMVAAPGSRLQKQVAVLTTLLAEARTPVAVTLTSDNKTDVNVYRVGRQGKFTSRQLSLRPGRYVVVGTRPGYRDVRVEFTLTADGTSATVPVQCTEPINP